MNTIQLNTNLHCGACLGKLSPVLNANQHIDHWEIDLNAPDKTLSVRTSLPIADIQRLVASAGFNAVPGNAGEAVTCDMYTARQQSGIQWGDPAIWKRAAFNTLNCLIGCSIGDFGMIIFLQAYYPATPMALQMALAVVAGLFTSILLESSILRYRERMSWGAAFRMAMGMSFLSMVAMEIAMNLTDFMITGGKMQLSDPLYWVAFAPAALAGFLIPLPYNYYKLKKFNKACH
ncbi:MAG: DUF4396 domain-containing protein [Chitinophagaceae bacterium]|jgi:hypothetical protein|nr:DUF4396 domain-containing protein [Chitinophagaceae bacterium]